MLLDIINTIKYLFTPRTWVYNTDRTMRKCPNTGVVQEFWHDDWGGFWDYTNDPFTD